MNRRNPLVFSALLSALLLLAACSQNPKPQAADTPGFSFSIDPAAGSVELDSVSLASLVADPVCENSVRTLIPGNELKISDYDFAFLPGNMLKITVAFTNTTFNTYEQPFSFSGTSSNVVSTTEPTLTDADLGGDGKLSPDETTTVLTFEVEHKGQAFTYNVSAEASVICGERPEGADLRVTQEDAQDPIVIGFLQGPENLEFTYTVAVENIGTTAASDVELIDTAAWDGPPLVLTSELPSECSYALGSAGLAPTSSVVCDLGTLASGGSRVYTFTFSPALIWLDGLADKASLEPQDIEFPLLTNTAAVTTTSPEVNIENNISVESTTLTFVEPEPEPEPEPCTEIVTIPDSNLEQAIRYQLSKPEGELTCGDLAGLQYLGSYYYNGETYVYLEINSLEGLQFATNLTSLDVYNSQLSDLSPLSGLTNLQFLYLSETSVSDISVVSRLTNLQSLGLSNTSVSDVSVLSNLTNLQSLSLGNTSVSDISVLSGLTNLRYLDLYNNSVSDISVLSNLTNLQSLYLSETSVSDISVLSNLTSLQYLYLYNTSVSDISVLSNLTNLQSLSLSNSQISDISALSGLTGLQTLQLYNTSVSDISALSGLTNLSYLYLYYNRISDISALVSNSGIGDGSDIIYLYYNCLDLSSGSQAQIDVTTLEDRNPGQQNIYADPQDAARCGV